jgi:hypothetical protein
MARDTHWDGQILCASRERDDEEAKVRRKKIIK